MKLVKEYINEKFENDSDPIKDMGIGLPALQRELNNRFKKFLKILHDHSFKLQHIDIKSGHLYVSSTHRSDPEAIINYALRESAVINYFITPGIKNNYIHFWSFYFDTKPEYKNLLDTIYDVSYTLFHNSVINIYFK